MRDKCFSIIVGDHGKLTPGYSSMVIEPDGLLTRVRQCAGGSASLCSHQLWWHGETTGADCACPLASRCDRLTSSARWHFMYHSRLLIFIFQISFNITYFILATGSWNGRKDRKGRCTSDLPMPFGEELNATCTRTTWVS